MLYLRALASGVNGMIFKVDLITASGNATNTPDKSDAVLNPFRASVALPDLNAPVGGVQALMACVRRSSTSKTSGIAPPMPFAGSNFNWRRTHE